MKRALETFGSVAGHTNYYLHVEKDEFICTLPNELIQSIFSLLGNMDLQSSYCVCQSWKEKIKSMNVNHTLEICYLTKFLNENLFIFYTDQFSALNRLNDLVNSLNSEFIFKKFLSDRTQFKDRLYNFLISLLIDDIVNIQNTFKKSNHLIHLEPICDLAILHKEIIYVRMKKNEDVDPNALHHLSLKLAHALSISENRKISSITASLFKEVITKAEIILHLGNIIERMNLLGKTPPIKEITEILVFQGEIKLAISYLVHITHDIERDSVCEYLSKSLAEKNYIEAALEIADEIVDDQTRFSTWPMIFSETQKIFR